MKQSIKIILSLSFIVLLFTSCNQQQEKPIVVEDISKANEALFVATMQKHLDAVTNKDLVALKSTMSPKSEMQLILPGSEIMFTVDAFMNYHKEWFAVENGWKFKTKILNTKVGETFGMAITEIVYSEPERNGKPYFNRMIVSYDLEKIDGAWYIIKDQASSVEKSTDKK